MLDNRYPDMARELVVALGFAAAPSDGVLEALCIVARANPMVASSARESMSKVFPGESCSE